MERLTIGGLAKQAHVNRETVRYYERRGCCRARRGRCPVIASFPTTRSGG
jgi:hypothetical protein